MSQSHPARHSSMLSASTSGTNIAGTADRQPPPKQVTTVAQQSPGLRIPSNRKTIYDRHLNRSRNAELSRASFAFLFAEMVTYAQRRVTGIQDLERRLNEQGYHLGLRLLDLLFYRSMSSSTSSALSSSSTSASPPNRPLHALEHSVSPETPNEYMITDNDPLVNTYISVPKEMSMLNCAAFVAGIIEGFAKVTAHNQPTEMWPGRTIFLLRFGESVMEREKVLERAGVK
ncbi:trafficking protein particle complex subunit 5 [Aspergillus novofumigatus IBT 16806]|uniref:Trafficking protein particle complex subunit n=1 Tax=Aspergillus novofumigatus (strain IBT 16806) TaxID=1392255 RepID=A0A2I1CJ20_ASPN1|nr:TRAPP I complex [Aspergillus novofumigatus IBT 16806]PKX97587.1 TRAPP I complex [Aspergillus novofumigatus IBT 16806]